LRYAYILRCDEVIKDGVGEITELRCSIDQETLGKNPSDGRKVKGIIHWVDARSAVTTEVRVYDHLFLKEDPDDVDEGMTFIDSLNPDSLETMSARVEPSLAKASPGDHFQFERLGYFCMDQDSSKEKPVFNKTVSLKDSWAKQAK
jgi:glutaminyl-tRNA synthetase